MTPPHDDDIGKRLNDREAVADALFQAAQDARKRHAQARVPAAAWHGGRVVIVNADDLTVIESARDSA